MTGNNISKMSGKNGGKKKINTMYIFLDESGQFTKHNDEEYFVVGSFTVDNQKRTDKKFKKWVKSKFPKRMRNQSEVKWSSTGIDDALRIRTFQFISKLDIYIQYGYLVRKNIPSVYRIKNELKSGLLYTNIIGEILEMYLPTDEKEIHIFCDQRPLKGMNTAEFRHAIINRLLPLCAPSTLIQVEMIDSTSNANIQIADWISGGLARYLEKRQLGEEYFKILENNFLSQGKEFFAE